jgi:hypothetical protein
VASFSNQKELNFRHFEKNAGIRKTVNEGPQLLPCVAAMAGKGWNLRLF